MTLASRYHSFSSGATMGDVRSLHEWHMLPRAETHIHKAPRFEGHHTTSLCNCHSTVSAEKPKSFASKLCQVSHVIPDSAVVMPWVRKGRSLLRGGCWCHSNATSGIGYFGTGWFSRCWLKLNEMFNRLKQENGVIQHMERLMV